MTTTVSDIEHIESTSLAGISVIKVFFPTSSARTPRAASLRLGAEERRPVDARHHGTDLATAYFTLRAIDTSLFLIKALGGDWEQPVRAAGG